MQPQQVQWRDGAPETVGSIEELDALLDRLADEFRESDPIWISINGPTGNLMVVLADTKGALSYIYPDSMPPYLMSVNGSNDCEEVDCYFADHHSPLMAKNLIPIEAVRQAVDSVTFIL
jgi:hypothetical protein